MTHDINVPNDVTQLQVVEHVVNLVEVSQESSVVVELDSEPSLVETVEEQVVVVETTNLDVVEVYEQSTVSIQSSDALNYAQVVYESGIPDHELDNSKIRFEKPDGTWGEYVDLGVSFSKVGEGLTIKDGVLTLDDVSVNMHYVGEYLLPPTEASLGKLWKQNTVYKNATDKSLYILTGNPLAWLLYVESGSTYHLTVESVNGTVFKQGQQSTTILNARLFKNGAEITEETPASWFRWRRVSTFIKPYPNDDATWNQRYMSGYRSIYVTVDDVVCAASFFCDVISP